MALAAKASWFSGSPRSPVAVAEDSPGVPGRLHFGRLSLVGEAHLSVRGAASGVLGSEDGHVGVDVVVDDDVGLGLVAAQGASDGLDDQSGVGDRSGEDDGVDDRRVKALATLGDGSHDQQRIAKICVGDAGADLDQCLGAGAATHDHRFGVR